MLERSATWLVVPVEEYCIDQSTRSTYFARLAASGPVRRALERSISKTAAVACVPPVTSREPDVVAACEETVPEAKGRMPIDDTGAPITVSVLPGRPSPCVVKEYQASGCVPCGSVRLSV